MAHKPNFTAQLKDKEAVMQVAASIGCLLTTGKRAGEGSITEMLDNIGGGEVLVMHHIYDHAEDIKADVKELRKMAKKLHPHENLRNTLEALASALESIQDVPIYND